MDRISFPVRLILDVILESDIAVARRKQGRPIAQGKLLPANQTPICLDFFSSAKVSSALETLSQIFASALNRALLTIRVESDNTLNLAQENFRLCLLTQNAYLIEFEPDENCFWLASDCLTEQELQFASPETASGLEHILTLGCIFVLRVTAGQSKRQALQAMVRLYLSWSELDKLHIQRILKIKPLDSGDLFSIFLQRVSSTPPLKNSSDWIDLQITWLLGQGTIDLPYSRREANAILALDCDPDSKRLKLYQLLRRYDHYVEQGNVTRMSQSVKADGQLLIFGRMSRAFHNQASLFADAVLVTPLPEWRFIAAGLHKLVAQSTTLQIYAGELQLLLESSVDVALIQLQGACERFEQAVVEVQKKALLELLANTRTEECSASDIEKNTTALMHLTLERLQVVARIRSTLVNAVAKPAAYVVISQRPSTTGSHLLVKINELQEPYLGKADNLVQLARLAGDRMYSSPDYAWLEVADHWIEAIPLFIKEQVSVTADAQQAKIFVDIAAMEESFREEMADYWARNIRHVLESEFIALARECICTKQIGIDANEAVQQCFGETNNVHDIAALALVFAEIYRQQIFDIHTLIEREQLEPYAAFKHFALTTPIYQRVEDLAPIQGSWLAAAKITLQESTCSIDFEQKLQHYCLAAENPRRALPALHILTTQSAGMTDGYIRTWLEESMTLFNIVDDLDLHGEVAKRQMLFAKRVQQLGEKIIRELGIWVEVEELCHTEQLSMSEAIAQVVQQNRTLQAEISLLGTLLEYQEQQNDDYSIEPEIVNAEWSALTEQNQEWALAKIYQRNAQALNELLTPLQQMYPKKNTSALIREVILADSTFEADLASYTLFAARRQALTNLDSEHPQQGLRDQSLYYFRRYQSLAKTTARKQIIAENNLNHLTLHPGYYYQATGGSKRYHLLYTPSRVDLGKRERESVESWSQWVGGADASAARVGRELFSLINKDVRVFECLTEPEILKTGENASMTAHFGFSNSLSLMVSATEQGDFEAMGDHMSRRLDRLIHPAGEGYGGYCVPKDGLFLEFVLSLTQREKLHQIGVPAALHLTAVAFAQQILAQRTAFSSEIAWQQWAVQQLSNQVDLGIDTKKYLGSQLFQVTRLAHVLESFGQAELHDPYHLTSSMAARWGLHKMVTGGEQVNRFMPFFKVWLIRQGILEAARRNIDHNISPENAIVVLTAEYKPDTQDSRFAVGMRKFEILAGTGEFLLQALDIDGQDLAILMDQGFAELERRGRQNRILAGLDMTAAKQSQLEMLRTLYPGFAAPAEIRLVSTTGLAAYDLLHYTSDTQLSNIAEQLRLELENLGLSSKEIDANLRSWGPNLSMWDFRIPLTHEARVELQNSLSGRIHALNLQLLGPERYFTDALRGADVLDVGIPHQELLSLVATPVHLCRLMRQGNPHSALVIVDGASGARHRSMNRLDVMLWFAAGDFVGRVSVYLSIGLGAQTVDAWRASMQHQRSRAQQLFHALSSQDTAQVLALYARIVAEIRLKQEAHLALAEWEKLHRFARHHERDQVISLSLARISGGVPVNELTFTDFLALGGIFIFNGATQREIVAARETYNQAIAAMGGILSDSFENLEALLEVEINSPSLEFRQEQGVESSNKATEDNALQALQTRQKLLRRIANARAISLRKTAFLSVKPENCSFAESYRQAMAAIKFIDQAISDADFGIFLAYCKHALAQLVIETSTHTSQADTFISLIDQLITGQQTDFKVWDKIAGGYEDIGEFGRLAQSVVEADTSALAMPKLAMIAQGIELFYILLALENTLTFSNQDPDAVETLAIWKVLADFFAKTINDHSYEYRPWAYSRGIGFNSFDGEALYSLAMQRHQWLYSYLRFIVLRYTEVKSLAHADQELLLGNALSGIIQAPIGGEAVSDVEKAWRCYGQLRELAFIRNDGFELPEIFPSFDPNWILAGRRVNHIIAVPVGRTHYSRALREGPTLCKQLESHGRLGANIIISRQIWVEHQLEYRHPVISIRSGHLYIDAETYCKALISGKGYSVQAAKLISRELHPKGIRIAARFIHPVLAALVYPFHGDPIYETGVLESCRLPYTVQSRFHTWTTYDKAKYPEIFAASGVDMPEEIDWLASYTRQLQAAAACKQAICNGLAGTNYPGLLHFIKKYPLLMLKDATESGGRGAQVFSLYAANGEYDWEQIRLATDFIYQISLEHNVAIQEVILSSPEHWATETFMRSFTHRQIVEWGSPVNRRREPRTPIFGSHRIIMSNDSPKVSDTEQNWHISHWITLNSKQLITNIGRGGTLDLLRPEIIRPEFQQTILTKLEQAGRRVMQALNNFENQAASNYTENTGQTIGYDLLNISYGKARYMMLDFLITPVFAETGRLIEVQTATADNAAIFILEDKQRRFPATVIDWRVVLIEPNIGVGLWDRVALREEYEETELAKQLQRPINWDAVGVNARQVLSDLQCAGESYLATLRNYRDNPV